MKRVAIALSGGIDSSVATALLLEQGYNVFGLTMSAKLPRDYKNISSDDIFSQSIESAKKIVNILGIEHYIINIGKEFADIVIKYFLNEYNHGRTPNPCIVCNPEIKWGILLRYAKKFGANYFATGHYARIEKPQWTGIDKYKLLKARSHYQDQSYMLWRLNQEQLAKTIFPVGELTKDKVRHIAKKYHFPTHEQVDSQEICFAQDYSSFIKQVMPDIKKGPIFYHTGEKLGEHQGIQFYTIGQRKGINIPFSKPLYVYKIDCNSNAIYVTDKEDLLYHNALICDDINLIIGDSFFEMDDINIKVRYRTLPITGKICMLSGNRIEVEFITSIRAISPGQSAVFYKDDELIGGGIITKSFDK